MQTCPHQLARKVRICREASYAQDAGDQSMRGKCSKLWRLCKSSVLVSSQGDGRERHGTQRQSRIEQTSKRRRSADKMTTNRARQRKPKAQQVLTKTESKGQGHCSVSACDTEGGLSGRCKMLYKALMVELNKPTTAKIPETKHARCKLMVLLMSRHLRRFRLELEK